MASRYEDRIVIKNTDFIYFEQFQNRDVPFVSQYITAKMTEPTEEDILELDIITHIWSRGDRLYKLADNFYHDPTYWWVIAWFNQKPLESDFKFGDVVNIPLPLEEVLSITNF